MNHPTIIRDLVLTRALKMLEHLCLQVSSYQPGELEVLKILEMPQRYEEAIALSNFMMERLGVTQALAHQARKTEITGPKDPRFDKTRRAMAKKRGRPPRGERSAGPPTEADAIQEAKP